MTLLAPGWYPDPDDPAARRYWDGQAWSAPLAAEQPAGGSAAATRRRTWTIAALVALGVGAVVLAAGLIIGFGTVYRQGVNCGSTLGGATNNGLTRDYENALAYGTLTSVSDRCQTALAGRKPTATALLVAGGALALVGLVGLGIIWSDKISFVAEDAAAATRGRDG